MGHVVSVDHEAAMEVWGGASTRAQRQSPWSEVREQYLLKRNAV